MKSFFIIQGLLALIIPSIVQAVVQCSVSTWAENEIQARSACKAILSFKHDDLKSFNDENKKICEDGCGNLISPLYLDAEDEKNHKKKLITCLPRHRKIISKYRKELDTFAIKNNCVIVWDKLLLDEDYTGKNHYKVETYTCSNKKQYDIIRNNQVGWAHKWSLNALCNKGILKKKFYLTNEYTADDVKKCQSETTSETAFCYYEFSEINQSEGDGDMPEITQANSFYYSYSTGCKKALETSEKVVSNVNGYIKQFPDQYETVGRKAKELAARNYQQITDHCNEMKKEIPLKSNVNKN